MISLGIYKSALKFMLPIIAILSILAACASFQSKKSVTAYFEEGALLVKKGKYDEAIKKYKKGLRIEPYSAVGYNYLGMAYGYKYEQLRSLTWRQKEIEAFRKAIELDANYFLPYWNLGQTYYAMGNFKEAARYLKKGLEIVPEHPNRERIEKMIQAAEREGK